MFSFKSNMVLLLAFMGPHTAAGPPFIPDPDSADKMGGRVNMSVLGIIYLFVYLNCTFVVFLFFEFKKSPRPLLMNRKYQQLRVHVSTPEGIRVIM